MRCISLDRLYDEKKSSSNKRFVKQTRQTNKIVVKQTCWNCSVGQDITIYTDHKNLTYKVFNTERVMRWRLICEEFGPKLVYLKGNKSIIADAISRMKLKPTPKSLSDDSVLEVPDTRELTEAFLIKDEDLPEWTIPISYKLLFQHQQKDKELKRRYLNKYYY